MERLCIWDMKNKILKKLLQDYEGDKSSLMDIVIKMNERITQLEDEVNKLKKEESWSHPDNFLNT